MPLLKRLFGQGKSKASNSVAALCIGDFSRLNVAIPWDVRQLESLLAHGAGDDSPSSSQVQSKSITLSGSQQVSRKALRHLLQHFGAGASSKEQTPQAEDECQRCLTQFLKQLGGYSEVSFVTATEDGQVPRDKVLSKLTKLFKHSTAPVVIVAYCGPSDERGNWRLSPQGPAASGGSGGGATGFSGGGGAGGGSCGTVLSFREVSMLWQRHRKHSQRLVLLLDCANSGYWVAALRMLSKAEQLELSLGVQASDCSLPVVQDRQLTYLPGIFTQLYLANNKWRRDGRRNTPQPVLAQPQAQQGADPDQRDLQEAAVHADQHPQPQADAQQQRQPPPQQQQQQQPGGGGGGAGGSQRVEQWLPGMVPSYYATWLSDNLVDYGIALRFFNLQAAPFNGSLPGGGLDSGARLRLADAAADAAAAAAAGPVAGAAAGSGWRTSTALLATAESVTALGRPSRTVDEVTAPPSAPWPHPEQPREPGRSSGEEPLDEHSGPQTAEQRAALRAALAQRVTSVHDAARRRFSSITDYRATFSDGVANTEPAATIENPISTMAQQLPERMGLHAGLFSSPQAEWHAATSPVVSTCQATNSAPNGPELRLPDSRDRLMSAQPSPRPAVDAAWRDSGVGVSAGSPHPHPLHPPSAFERASGGGGGGAAVHPWDIDVEDPDSGHTGLGAGRTGGEEELEVQPSARSDTVAMTWDRRSTHAERGLLEVEDRGLNVACSFTGGPGEHHGFVNQLFGALHEVATERRLRARRAPLEGDESIDAMMQDADLDRRASNASLPSFMLPRDSKQAGHDATTPNTMTFTTLTGAALPVSGATEAPSAGRGGNGGAGAVMALLTPRTSVLGAPPSERPSGRQSLATPRQLSRLFMMSVAEAVVAAADAMELPASFEGDVAESGELDLAAAAQQPQQPALLQQLQAQRRQQQPALHGYTARHESEGSADKAGAGAAGGSALLDNDMTMLMQHAESVEAPAERGGLATDSPQMCASPALSPMPSLLDRRRGTRASGAANASTSSWLGHSGGGASSGMLRSLLKQQVSIADSVDLDAAASGSPAAWQRRPGRFEVAGSESSSFLFGDDTERFEMLRLLREQGGDEDGDDEPEAGAGGGEEGGPAAGVSGCCATTQGGSVAPDSDLGSQTYGSQPMVLDFEGGRTRTSERAPCMGPEPPQREGSGGWGTTHIAVSCVDQATLAAGQHVTGQRSVQDEGGAYDDAEVGDGDISLRIL